MDRSWRGELAGDTRRMDWHLKQIEHIERDRFLRLQQLFPVITIDAVFALLLALPGAAQTAAPEQSQQPVSRPAVHSHRSVVRDATQATPELCARCVQSNLNYLAGPALHGRGSGTEDEHHAAQFIATKLKVYGLAPAAGDGKFIQTVMVAPQARQASPRADKSNNSLRNTWNVLGKIEGTTENGVILLSAHFDHLGVIQGKTYYGADDDASGTAAVMELARMLAAGPKPARTVVVALWGSEEAGLVGSSYFLEHPTFPLNTIVANLEFEMVGRPDPKLKPDELWLSGWDRTNLGPELVRHGARLVADPHQQEKFFTRSDNFSLAQEGIVAQTVSSFGLHKDYHQPTDTVDKIDFQHMDRIIASMIGPVTWLANTDFKPEWAEGKKP